MSTINIGTSSTTAFKVESDTTGALTIKTGSGPTTAVTISSSGDLTRTASTSGAGNYIKVINTSNTADSGSFLTLQTGGTSAGAAAIEYYNGTSARYAGFTGAMGDYFIGGNASTSSAWMVLNGTGLGIGVTPTTWTLLRPMQFADTAFIAGQSSAEAVYLGSNTYYNSGWKYLTSNTATYYSQGAGAHAWYTTGSGTAGNTITWTTVGTIGADGRWLTGTTTYSPYNYTTASAANCYLANDGTIQRSTSSLRYKTDVETLQDQYADLVLQMRPVWYRSLGEKDPKHYGYYGLIAEEVAEKDPRLVHYGYAPEDWETVTEDGKPVSRLKEGAQLRPEGVQYERIVPALINIIQRLEKRVAALEDK